MSQNLRSKSWRSPVDPYPFRENGSERENQKAKRSFGTEALLRMAMWSFRPAAGEGGKRPGLLDPWWRRSDQSSQRRTNPPGTASPPGSSRRAAASEPRPPSPPSARAAPKLPPAKVQHIKHLNLATCQWWVPLISAPKAMFRMVATCIFQGAPGSSQSPSQADPRAKAKEATTKKPRAMAWIARKSNARVSILFDVTKTCQDMLWANEMSDCCDYGTDAVSSSQIDRFGGCRVAQSEPGAENGASGTTSPVSLWMCQRR